MPPGLGFLHPPLAVAAALLAAIPLLIHLLNRRRHRRIQWAAMDFLLAAAKRNARRIRLEQFLLLAMRTMALFLLVIAAARPFVADSSWAAPSGSAHHRVIVIDDSFSMQASESTASRFDAAVERALGLLDSFPRTDPISLVMMSAPARVVARGSLDRRSVRERLAELAPTDRATDVATALDHCAQLVRESEVAPHNQSVYLLTDLARSSWGIQDEAIVGGAVTAARRLAERATVHVIRCGAVSASNVAVTAFGSRRALAGGHEPLRLFADVTNHGDTTLRGGRLNVLNEGRIARRVDVPPIAADAVERVTFSIAAGDHRSLRLEAAVETQATDVLRADDRRHLALQVAESVPVLVVGAARDRTGSLSAAAYVTAAMAPGLMTGESSLLAPQRVRAAELDIAPLDDYALLWLCDVGALGPQRWRRIQEFVQSGGGLIVTSGEQMNPDDLNRNGYADGNGVLPARAVAQQPVVPGGEDPARRFVVEPGGHPLMTDFVDAPGASLFRARVDRYLVVVPHDAAEVIARYDNGAPAIVARRVGQGRSILLTTSADTSWGNLPAKGDFVSLVHKLIGYASPQNAEGRNVVVGASFARPLSPGEANRPVALIDPDGQTSTAEVEGGEAGFTVVCRALTQRGFYRLDTASGAEFIAVNTAPAESDLASVTDDELRRSVGGNLTITPVTNDAIQLAQTGGSAEMAALLAYVGLLLLLCETLLATRFAAGR